MSETPTQTIEGFIERPDGSMARFWITVPLTPEQEDS